MTVRQFSEKAEISLSLAYIRQKDKRGAIRVTEEDFQRFIESTKAQEVDS